MMGIKDKLVASIDVDVTETRLRPPEKQQKLVRQFNSSSSPTGGALLSPRSLSPFIIE